ncbi:glycosyl hydrolase [Arcicella rosea]|uniref:Beta-mannanase n=1 Tax=Arcicella rosea TaxID=502909 RepID=A0A841EJD9_9BACT|nr:glycosyl hydrolase [Arcicella rosea]MBB6004307.1 beta-mannanase [Arcicella rosea]
MNPKLKYSLLIIFAVFALAMLKLTKPFIQSFFVDEFTDRFYEPLLGVYDKTDNHKKLNFDKIQHVTIIWKNTGVWFYESALEKTLNTGNDVFLTIETWSKNGVFSESDGNVIAQTIAGDFDEKVVALGNILSKYHQQIFIRWNPAMEVPEYRYPWQFQSPILYIQAFNKFALQLKKIAPKVKIVWGPSGYAGDTEYWPGEKYVDFVSITLSENQVMTDTSSIHAEIIKQLKQKLHQMRFINKPIVILGAVNKMKTLFHQGWINESVLEVERFKNTIYSSQNFVSETITKPTRDKMILGVYDPLGKLLHQPNVQVEHIFTDWGEIQKGEFTRKFNEVIQRKHDVILTVEPWKGTTKVVDKEVLQNVLKGRYDREISLLYHIITKTNHTVYLRWAHEMEIPIHRYTWQSQDPVVYINAYRYFMLFNKNQATNIRRVWGPAGDRGSIDWWPGNDVVDFISIAIYGLPDKNITDYNKQELFSDIFSRKFYRMRFAEKPIFITEFGVKGPKEYQNKWMKNAAETLKNNKNVFGVSYFNQHDTPDAWGKIKAPDWSISESTFQQFSKALE